MWKTILRRLLMMIPQIIILSIIIFIVAQMMPGDPFAGLINPNIDPAELARLREAAGLNDPWPTQYVRWVNNLMHGDLGRSFVYSLPVTTLIGQRVGNTVSLSLLTSVLTYLLALPMGLLAGRYENSWFDKFVQIYSYLTFAVPLFVFGLVMLFTFGFNLGWFPTSGSVQIGVAAGLPRMISRFQHMILPAITQALLATTVTVQYLRSEVIDAQKLDFVRTARSKGVPTDKVFSRHIFRNASLPIAATLGFEIAGLIGGSVIIERIFSYPGLGNLFILSTMQRDYAVITSLTLIFGTVALVAMLISDIIMSLVDPRIRIQ